MKRYLITSLFIALLGGCSNIDSLGFPGVHKIDIQQGNLFTDEMVELLRPGLTQRQVQYVMGTPLVVDTFNPNHWDYVYQYRHGDPGHAYAGGHRHVVWYDRPDCPGPWRGRAQ